MGVPAEVTVTAIIFALSGAGVIYWRLIHRPIRRDLDQMGDDVDHAIDRARKALREVRSLRQMLQGTEADADEGVLQRLNDELVSIEQELTQIRGQIQRQARIDTEHTRQVSHVVEQLNDIDGIQVERRQDGWVVREQVEDDFYRNRTSAETN